MHFTGFGEVEVLDLNLNTSCHVVYGVMTTLHSLEFPQYYFILGLDMERKFVLRAANNLKWIKILESERPSWLFRSGLRAQSQK